MKKDEALSILAYPEGNRKFRQRLQKMLDDDERGSSRRAYQEPFHGTPWACEGDVFKDIDDAAKAKIHLSLVSYLPPFCFSTCTITKKSVSPYTFCGCRRRPSTARGQSVPRLSQQPKMPSATREAMGSSTRCEGKATRRSDFTTARSRKNRFGFSCGKPRTFGGMKDFLKYNPKLST